MDLATGESRQLTDNEIPDLQPDWSPNGLEIMFVRSLEVSEQPSRLQLMLVGADGSLERVLFQCPSTCLDPKWSPDGELIAFEMDNSIWTIRRDGSEPREVSGEQVGMAEIPAWSPDSRRLVYWGTLEATSASNAKSAVLVVLDLNTGEETILLSGVSPLDPDWSPDGSSILYSDQAAPQIQWTLFDLDLETGVSQRLIPRDLERDIFDAVWSPDGKRIAFAYGFRNTRSDLYILDLAELGAVLDPSGDL